jgi:TolA-binding protein
MSDPPRLSQDAALARLFADEHNALTTHDLESMQAQLLTRMAAVTATSALAQHAIQNAAGSPSSAITAASNSATTTTVASATATTAAATATTASAVTLAVGKGLIAMIVIGGLGTGALSLLRSNKAEKRSDAAVTHASSTSLASLATVVDASRGDVNSDEGDALPLRVDATAQANTHVRDVAKPAPRRVKGAQNHQAEKVVRPQFDRNSIDAGSGDQDAGNVDVTSGDDAATADTAIARQVPTSVSSLPEQLQLYDQGQLALQQHHYGRGIVLLQQYLDVYPEGQLYQEAAHALLKALITVQNYSAVLTFAAMHQADKRIGQHYAMNVLVATAHAATGDCAAARDVLKRANKLAPPGRQARLPAHLSSRCNLSTELTAPIENQVNR